MYDGGEVSCSKCDDSAQSNLFLKNDGTCGSCSEVIPLCGGCVWLTDHTQCVFCAGKAQLSGSDRCCDTESLLYPDYKGGCDTCENVIYGCTSCKMNGGIVDCIVCDEDNGFISDGDQCCDTKVGQFSTGRGCTSGLCSDGCSICIQNNGNYECQVCDVDDGYSLSGTICCKSGQDQFPDTFGGCDSCGNLVEGCNSCLVRNGVIGCTRCITDEGYQLSGRKCCNTHNDLYPDESNDCAPCRSVIPECSACFVNEGVTSCQVCSSSYSLYDGTCCLGNEFPNQSGSCESCASLKADCLSCEYDFENSQVDCVQCDGSSDKFLYEGSCQVCQVVIRGCMPESCVRFSQLQCAVCEAGYQLDVSQTICCKNADDQYPAQISGCKNCQDLIPGCIQCQANGGSADCISCDSGYTASGTICCEDALEIPDGSGGCAEPCTDGCLSCPISSEICQSCNTGAGYELSGNICCNTNIDEYPDGVNGCRSCSSIEGCSSCVVISGITHCSACNSTKGFYLSGSICCNTLQDEFPVGQNTCVSCFFSIFGCQTCSYTTGIVQCQKCLENHSLSGNQCCNHTFGVYPSINGRCDFCEDIITGCSSCIFEQITECQACENGFVLSSSTKCCEVTADLFPDKQGECELCSTLFPNCQECEWNSQSSTFCSQCAPTFALLNNQCVQCSEGQVVSIDGSSCLVCSDIHPNCIQCDPHSTCTNCAEGYSLLLDGSACVFQCTSININCLTCQTNLCTQCNEGYALTSPTICTQCDVLDVVSDDGTACVACSSIDANCYLCEDESTCISCLMNFVLTSPTECTQCTSSQIISDDGTQCIECSSIDQHCVSCSSEQVCDTCISGYNLVGMNRCQAVPCEQIDPNCAECDGILCTSCLPGYARQRNSCVYCSSGQTVAEDGQSCVYCSFVIPECISCSSPTNCLQCEEGLVLISPTLCSTCSAGQVFDGSICVPCTLSHCAVCDTPVICRQCQEGYIYNTDENRCIATTTCGNYYEQYEECDDGNTKDGDGCSAVCTVENGYSCDSFPNFASLCYLNCGDGKLDVGEQCDDGNIRDFDGCSGCIIEDGYRCNDRGCSRLCGDGQTDNGEQCDDGNSISGDGCSSSCRIEVGWSCSSTCLPTCGDGLKLGNEMCDDGNFDIGDGCFRCFEESGWACEGSLGEKSICRTFESFCGNGVYEFIKAESCDDGNQLNGDGCSAQCRVEKNWICDNTNIVSVCSECGNGSPDDGEQCDDLNRRNFDGCSAECKLEDGFECSQQFPSICRQVPVCYDGSYDPLAEGCDDGNSMNGDGCSKQCLVEAGWECSNFIGGMSQCSLIPACANAVFQPTNNEGCDDGNTMNGDGCSDNCMIEELFKCSNAVGQKSVCERDYQCGNRVHEIENEEECDDGNQVSSDGCSSTCQIQPGWMCVVRKRVSICLLAGQSSPSPTEGVSICGDGNKQENEQCDDNNSHNGDGCSSSCQIQEDFECLGSVRSASVCRRICGNRRIDGQEECDDGNGVNGDGCTSDCKVEKGFSCQGSNCVNLCGNGEMDQSFHEECDDGNQRSGDGCSPSCQVQLGWECSLLSNDRSFCSTTCSNGKYQPNFGEECDDGNVARGDGCFNCAIQPEWVCSQTVGVTSECRSDNVEYCMNGKYEPFNGEECDDGNSINTDGCSNSCHLNANFFCSNILNQRSMCGLMNDGTCVEGVQIPNLKLLPSEMEALSQTPFSQVSTFNELIPLLIKRTNGVVSADLQPYTLAKNAFYRSSLFSEWFKIDYFVQMCAGN